MLTPQKRPAQPSAPDLQAIQDLLQRGLLVPAETKAQALLQRFPQALPVLNLLGVSQQGQGKHAAAIVSFQQMLAMAPHIPELHFNLGVLYTQTGETESAIASYRQAIQLKPNFPLAYFNLGALWQAQGKWAEAARQYQQALAFEPNYVEALGNLGAVLQQSGQLAAAEGCYRRALTLREDARGHFNIGTVCHDRGEHSEAIAAFQRAITLEPAFADAWNHLGETWRDQGNMPEAVRSYQQALAAQASNGRALYNLGEYYCLAGQLVTAIPYFEGSDFADAAERALQCYYKTSQFERFEQQFAAHLQTNSKVSVLMATLSQHYASNFGVVDRYPFCAEPMQFVQHTKIAELAEANSPFLTELLAAIQNLAIAERKQGRLYYGMQSAGNLLLRDEPVLQKLAAIIRSKVSAYQQHYASKTCALINDFPAQIEFSSSWYLRMQQGGYLTSHIHEEGWLSGCLYLQMPDNANAHEGSFEYSTDGDEYPRRHDNFPRQVIDPKVGDLVLFPSSLFHRTLPFNSDQARVCVAFDVMPG